MTTTQIHPPVPADPEAAALDLIVAAAEEVTGGTVFRQPLRFFCSLPADEGVLGGLTWHDARLVAAAISFDACTENNPAASLRFRARIVGGGGGECRDR